MFILLIGFLFIDSNLGILKSLTIELRNAKEKKNDNLVLREYFNSIIKRPLL